MTSVTTSCATNCACRNCAFYHGKVTNEAVKVLHVPQHVPGKRITNHVPVEMGECRRRPPTPATSTNHDWQFGSGHGIWPAVLPNEWCGEFRSAASELITELEHLGRCIIQCRADGKYVVVVVDGVGQSFVDAESISQDDATLRANHWGERGLLVVWTKKLASARPWP